MRRLILVIAALALTVTFACESKKGEEKPKEPAFEPTASVDREVLGGTLKAPENLAVNLASEEDGETVTLSAEGFPTITLVRGAAPGWTGSKGGTRGGTVEVEIANTKYLYTCKAESVGDYKELVQDICNSFAAKLPENPHISEGSCEKIEGYDKAAVDAAWTGAYEDIAACFGEAAKTEDSLQSAGFGYNLTITPNANTELGPNRNATSWTSPVPEDEAFKGCLKTALDAAFNADTLREPAEGGTFECKGTFARY